MWFFRQKLFLGFSLVFLCLFYAFLAFVPSVLEALDKKEEIVELYLILAAIIAVAIALFAIQNATPVVVSFLLWRFESSLAVVIILAITAGIAITWLITIPSRIRRRRELGEKSRRVEELERRVKELEEILSQRQGPTPEA